MVTRQEVSVANVLDCNIVVSEFELQSRYYVHFRTIVLGKVMNSLIPSSNGLNNSTIVLAQSAGAIEYTDCISAEG